MNEQEIEVSNEQIELHNKFCFMKKKIPKYKKIVPLSHFMVYAMVIACLLALPSFLTTAGELTASEISIFRDQATTWY